MNDPQNVSANNRHVSIPIPPPPLPPNFPPPIIPPPAFPVPPPQLIPQFPDKSVSSFPTHTFQSDCILLAATWDAFYSTRPEHQSSAEVGSQDKVDCWMKSKNILAVDCERPNNKVKLHTLKGKFNAAYSLIKELENDARTLNVMVKTVAPHEWNQKCNEIELKKRELLSAFDELKLSKEEIVQIKEKCLKRSKKRARLKRQALKRNAQKENEKVISQNLHIRIDNWQREMQEIVERTKREQELKQEADAVLWGVRQRRSEARRQLELLTTLQDLREARVRRRSAAGQSTSTVEVQTFNTVINRLKVLWNDHLSKCQLEEQALRGMLAEDEITQDPVSTYKKLVLKEWQIALFGPGSSIDNNPSLEDTRRSWDQFVVDEHTVLASTIPPGWVLPTPPSSHQWQSLLKY